MSSITKPPEDREFTSWWTAWLSKLYIYVKDFATTIAGKADKLPSSTSGNIATLDGNGNLGGELDPSTLGTIGKHQIWIPSSQITPRTVNGPSRATIETPTNNNIFEVLNYDQTTEEYAQFGIILPKSWDAGTIYVGVAWIATLGSGNVVWSARARAYSNTDADDAAWGTTHTGAADASSAANTYQLLPLLTQHIPISTFGSTPAKGDYIIVEVLRQTGHSLDTYAGDAGLIGVLLTYTTDANTDD